MNWATFLIGIYVQPGQSMDGLLRIQTGYHLPDGGETLNMVFGVSPMKDLKVHRPNTR
jgi:hypothetical protein